MTFPNSPGFKVAGPSEQAARQIAGHARTLRADVWRVIHEPSAGITADEIAAKLGKSILSVRPRVSELHRLGMIEPTGGRGRNESGMTATVWKLAASLPVGEVS